MNVTGVIIRILIVAVIVLVGNHRVVAADLSDIGMPEKSWIIDGFGGDNREFSEIEAIEIIGSKSADGIEGIWQASDDGARIAVISDNDCGSRRNLNDLLLMVIVESPRATIEPGTVMGWAVPTAKPGYFRSMVFTVCDVDTLLQPKPYTLHLADKGHLTMTPVKKGIEFLPWRLLPYLFRSAFRRRDNTIKDLDGFIRIWPHTEAGPMRPRVL